MAAVSIALKHLARRVTNAFGRLRMHVTNLQQWPCLTAGRQYGLAAPRPTPLVLA